MVRSGVFLWRWSAIVPLPAMLLGTAVLLRLMVLLRRALLVVGRMKLGVRGELRWLWPGLPMVLLRGSGG